MPSLAMQPSDVAALVVVGSSVAAYLAYHYGLGAHVPLGDEPEAEARLLRQRGLGGLLMGVVPVAACVLGLGWEASSLGLAWPELSRALAWVGGCGLVLGPLLWRASQSPVIWRDAPRLRVTAWTRAMLARNTLGWMVYLAGYETPFPGRADPRARPGDRALAGRGRGHGDLRAAAPAPGTR